MILAHLADELSGACPTTRAGFLYWVFTPVGGDTWVHAAAYVAGTYEPRLMRNAGAGWALDPGAPADSITGWPWVASNTNAWIAAGSTTIDFWRRTGAGWGLITSLDNSGALISSSTVYTSGPGVGETWGVYTRMVTGAPTVHLGTWDGSTLTFSPYSGAPANGVHLGLIRGAPGNLWLLLQVDKGVGGGYLNTWLRQLDGSTPGADYTDATLDNVDSACNELYPCPDGTLWGAGWQWTNTGAARHAAVWRHDGTSWTVSTPPLPATEATSQLYGIHGVSASEVWAVGYWTDTSNTSRVLLLHWDGSAWTPVAPAPDYSNAAGGIDPYLVAVQMRSATDGWAVGAACSQWLSYHWNGTTWAEAPITGV